MYIPVGERPNTMAELVADLERRQSASPARGDLSSRASAQSANTANTGTMAPRAPVPAPTAPAKPPAETIPIGAQPRSLAELVEDLERRQANRPAVGNDASSVASGQSPPSVASANSAATSNAGRVIQPPPVAPAPALPPAPAPAPALPAVPAPALGVAPATKAINERAEDLVDFLVGLDRRQARNGRVGTSVPSVQSANSAPSVNSAGTSNAGRVQPPAPAPPTPPPAVVVPAPSAPTPVPDVPAAASALSGKANDLVDFLVHIDRRQARPPVGGRASSVASRQSANSQGTNNSVGTSRAGRGGQRAPVTPPPATPPAPAPAPALGAPTTPAARAISGRAEELADFLVELDRRQANSGRPAGRGRASSVASRNSVNSVGTNNSAATSNGRQRAPPAAAPAPAPPAAIVAKSIAIGEQPSSMAELMADLDRRQANRAPNGRDDATSVASRQSAASANSAATTNVGRGRPAAPAPAPPAPAPPAVPVALEAKSIPIGGQPNSLSELLADLEKRQEQPSNGKAPSVSSNGSSASAASAQSKPGESATTAAPAQSTQPAVALPGQAQSPPSPTSLTPLPETTPAASGGSVVQSPATRPTSAGAADQINGAAPLPTTLQTVSSATPMSTALPTAPTNVAQPLASVPVSAPVNIETQPQMNAGMMAGAIVGSILGVALISAIVFLCRRRRQRQREFSSISERSPNWESRLYGSDTSRSTMGGARNTIRSFFARRSVAEPAALGNTSEIQGGLSSQNPPALPKSAFNSRRSERSTGLSDLDEKQYKTYQNLVGRLNQKQPLPFDHPYYQQDEWK